MIEMLTGTLPMDGQLPQGLQQFEPGVARLASECVARESDQRPRSAADVIRRLEEIARPAPEGEAAKTKADATSSVQWRVQRDVAWITRLTLEKRIRAALGVAGAVAVVAIAAWFAHGKNRRRWAHSHLVDRSPADHAHG